VGNLNPAVHPIARRYPDSHITLYKLQIWQSISFYTGATGFTRKHCNDHKIYTAKLLLTQLHASYYQPMSHGWAYVYTHLCAYVMMMSGRLLGNTVTHRLYHTSHCRVRLTQAQSENSSHSFLGGGEELQKLGNEERLHSTEEGS
jgi:hypothetical protein